MSARAWKRRRNKPKCGVYWDSGVCGQRVAKYGGMCERHRHPVIGAIGDVMWRAEPRAGFDLRRAMNEMWVKLTRAKGPV